ncbi:MAG: hypothetical protein ACTSRK_17030 [Promethearchaeota archaeon]
MTMMTPNELKKKGIEALTNALGPVGMAKFLQQFDLGSGDYTKDRKKWLGAETIKSITDEIKKSQEED